MMQVRSRNREEATLLLCCGPSRKAKEYDNRLYHLNRMITIVLQIRVTRESSTIPRLVGTWEESARDLLEIVRLMRQ